mgnify:CR=1 FL=1
MRQKRDLLDRESAPSLSLLLFSLFETFPHPPSPPRAASKLLDSLQLTPTEKDARLCPASVLGRRRHARPRRVRRAPGRCRKTRRCVQGRRRRRCFYCLCFFADDDADRSRRRCRCSPQVRGRRGENASCSSGLIGFSILQDAFSRRSLRFSAGGQALKS